MTIYLGVNTTQFRKFIKLSISPDPFTVLQIPAFRNFLWIKLCLGHESSCARFMLKANLSKKIMPIILYNKYSPIF